LPRTLIIAEKPSVASDIARVVGADNKGAHAWEGSDHVVSWAVGHLLEFVAPEGYDTNLKRWRLKDLPILPDQFLLTPVKGNTKQLNALKKLLKAKDVERVINACDAGREGELIFREIFRYSGSTKPVERLWLQSMTDDGIRQSLAGSRPEAEVQGLADAADCRAESDWLIGMNATRALTVRLRSQRDRVPWSAGRVQTATLAMLVRREKEILGHEALSYWVIKANFKALDDPTHDYEATWFDPKASGQRDRIFEPAVRDRVLAVLASSPQGKARETRKDSREVAPTLLDLTSLQREANRRFGFSARRTLGAAQALYEQHKMITYPRTDSRALPSDYQEKVQEALTFLARDGAYGAHASRLLADGLSNIDRNFNDAAVSDHFAIIPTGQGDPEQLRADDRRIFDLVARRFLAAFHPPAISTEVERITELGDEAFRTRSRVLKTPGWKSVFERADKEPRLELPQLADPAGSPAGLGEHQCDEKQTRPPARLTEAAVLGLMETAGKEVEDADKARVLKETGGLGTPATRAEIIETLVDRQYASRCSSLQGRKALRATPRGIRLIDALERIDLPLLTSAELTANLEDALRDVEHGSATRDGYMGEVRTWTKKIVEQVRGFSFATLYEGTEPVGECPACKEGKIYESLRTWSCERGGREGPCEFVIWKEVGGRYVDWASAVELIEKAETPVKAGFFSREGREYEASLVRTDDGRVLVRPKGAEIEDNEEVAPADVGPCPYCKGKMVRRSNKGYRCDGYADRSCKLNLPLQVCQRALSLEEAVQLISEERKTGLLEGFVSKRNRPFSATLHMDEGAKIRWEFPPRDNRRANEAPSKEFEVNPEPLGKCPKHPTADVIETATNFECSDESCRIRIPREICKRELVREEAIELFANNETRVLEGFTSRTGKPFAASLYIKRTGRHGFRFGPRSR
jgi:DNA topoisomerase III